MMRKLVFILIALMSISACNTMQGIGRDIEAGGEAISGTASKTKNNMKNN